MAGVWLDCVSGCLKVLLQEAFYVGVGYAGQDD
jgi:hypothetical protein